MPATYAHLCFGRHVLRELPEGDLKALIDANPDLFEIGLIGPDILFFYHPLRHHPVNRIGYRLHDESGVSFLERALCKDASAQQMAYLLGFVCHYTLDSECHTLVEYYMEKTGRGHSDLETDLERVLMLRDGRDPCKHVAAGNICDTGANAAVIAPFYGIKGREVKTALTTMKLVGRLLTPSSALKHKLLTQAGRLMGEGSVVSQLTMNRTPDPVYAQSNRELTARMEQAVPVAVALMENFLAWRRGEGTLSQRFLPTFSYDERELARLKERDMRV